MSHSHNKYVDIPKVDNEFAAPFRQSAFQSPLLAGVPTGVNKPNGTGTPPLTNWPEHRNEELPMMMGGSKRKRSK